MNGPTAASAARAGGQIIGGGSAADTAVGQKLARFAHSYGYIAAYAKGTAARAAAAAGIGGIRAATTAASRPADQGKQQRVSVS